MNSKEKLQAEIDAILSDVVSDLKKSQNEEGKELTKSFDEVSDSLAKQETVDIDANGKGDIIKNKEEKEKKVETMNKKKKKNDEDDDNDDDNYGGPDDGDEDDKELKKKKMKKSFQVSAREYERLQKAIQEDNDRLESERAKSSPLFKSVQGMTTLLKSLSDQVSSLTDKVESFKRVPVREPKALTSTDTLEKSQLASAATTSEASDKGTRLMKSQVIDAMMNLQRAGKVTDNDVILYESSTTMRNEIKQLVLDKAKELSKI